MIPHKETEKVRSILTLQVTKVSSLETNAQRGCVSIIQSTRFCFCESGNNISARDILRFIFFIFYFFFKSTDYNILKAKNTFFLVVHVLNLKKYYSEKPLIKSQFYFNLVSVEFSLKCYIRTAHTNQDKPILRKNALVLIHKDA